MTDDPGDRHVLACAVAADSELVVTLNLDHFPNEACEPVGVEARHPDDFLLGLAPAGLGAPQASGNDLVPRPRSAPRFGGVRPRDPSHESTWSSFGPFGQRPSGASAVEPAVCLRDLPGMAEDSRL